MTDTTAAESKAAANREALLLELHRTTPLIRLNHTETHRVFDRMEELGCSLVVKGA